MSSADTTSKSRIASFFQFGIVNILRNFLGLIRAKFIAIWFGGTGIGILGQYIAFFSLQSKVVMFGATASMINSHHMAEEKSWDSRKLLFYHLLIIFLTNIIIAGLLILNLDYINKIIFTGEVGSDFMVLIIIVGVLYSSSTYLEMIIQAQKRFKVLSRGRNISLIIALGTCIPIIYYWGISGILYNLIILYLSSFIYFFVFFKNEKIITISIPNHNDLPILKYIFKVSIIDLTRSFLVIGSLLIGKTIIVNALGMTKNGYIQSIWSISNYINVLSTGFMVYYFPVINSQKDEDLLRDELNSSFKLLISILFPLILVLTMIPKFLVTLLYTTEFLVVSQYLTLLMLAKFLELFYYFYTINFLGRNQFRNFILLEGLRSFFFILLMFILINNYDLPGAIWAILITEVISISIIIFLLRNNVSIQINQNNIWLYLKMLFLLVLVVFIPGNTIVKIPFVILYYVLFLDIKYYINLFLLRKI